MLFLSFFNSSIEISIKEPGDISKSTLNKYGAVSKQIAKLMLNNLYNISKSKLCVSTTGIAGPLGGTKNKPVGLVFIGIKFGNKITILRKKYKGTRKQIQKKAIEEIFKKIYTLI